MNVMGVRTVFAALLACLAIPALAQVGVGSQYAAVFVDSKGQPFDGGKNYKLHLPPKIPAKDFWSLLPSAQWRARRDGMPGDGMPGIDGNAGNVESVSYRT